MFWRCVVRMHTADRNNKRQTTISNRQFANDATDKWAVKLAIWIVVVVVVVVFIAACNYCCCCAGFLFFMAGWLFCCCCCWFFFQIHTHQTAMQRKKTILIIANANFVVRQTQFSYRLSISWKSQSSSKFTPSAGNHWEFWEKLWK